MLVTPGKPLSFMVGAPWSSARFFVDGQLQLVQGDPGKTLQTTELELRGGSIISLLPQKDEVVLVVEVANFEMHNGGGLSISLGTEEHLQKSRLRWMSYNLFALGALMIMGFYHLTLFFLRRKDRSTLAFGLFCLSGACYLYFGSIAGMLKAILPIKGTHHIMAFNIAWKLSIPAFIAFFHYLYPQDFSKAIVKLFLFTSGLYVVMLLILPLPLYLRVINGYQALTGFGVIYTFFAVISAYRRKREGIRTFSFFSSLLLLAVINDLLFTSGFIRSFPMGPGATVLFVFGQSYLLSTRFARAFATAEHLTENLQSEVASQTQALTQQRDTLEKQAQELEQAHRDLQHLDVLKTAFFRQVSHELRTPLTLIMGSLNQAGKSGHFQEGIDVAQKNARRLLRLVNQLLDFQRIKQNNEQMTLLPINLRDLLHSVCDYFQVTCKDRGIHFTFHDTLDPSPSVMVAGEPDGLETIFFNYLSNALKYTPKGGSIQVWLEESNGFCRVRVQDSGCGIAPEHIDKLFRVFVRLQDHDAILREGTGIGLALCRELAEAMHGRVGVDSEPGKGSSFWVELPRGTASLEQDHLPIVDVLFVDDEIELRRIFAESIVQFTQISSFRMAESFEEAVTLMNSFRFRCIISDINLRSAQNGVDLLIYAAQTQAWTQRIIWTAERSGELLQKAINEAKIASVLFKPCNFAIELPKIETILRQSSLHEVPLQDPEHIAARALLHVADIKATEASALRYPERWEEGQPTLLLVDDIPDLRRLIRSILAPKAYNFIECSDGQEALLFLQSAKHPVDILLTDWMMPRMSGPELIEALQKDERFQSLPTILLTAKSDDQSRSWAIQHGASAYLSKPFDELELLSTVENLLNLKRQERKIADLNRYITVNVLQRFLPSSLVQSIIEGRSTLDDGAKTRSVTVLFADLCAFTSTTERLGPRKIAEILNQFLTDMTEVIFEHEGTIDKFLGDGILVIFGAPSSMDPSEQVLRARNCSLAMQEHLQNLNHQWTAQGYPPFRMRIGIHHGPAIIGSFGGPKRSDYTVIGHTVNLASRIQGLAEPDHVLVSQAVRDLLPDDGWVDGGQHKIRGLNQEMALFRLIPKKNSDAA
jgi:signal transduction histidine kinase/class 3 adenylate cyclase/CheY-like chemotaxis protein